MNKLRLSTSLVLLLGVSAAAYAYQNCTTLGTPSTLVGAVCTTIITGDATGSSCSNSYYTGGGACSYDLPPSPTNDASCSNGTVHGHV